MSIDSADRSVMPENDEIIAVADVVETTDADTTTLTDDSIDAIDVIDSLDETELDEAAEDDGLAVPDADVGDDLAEAEARQGKLRAQGDGAGATTADGLALNDECAGVVIVEELRDGGDDGHLNRKPIGRHVRNDIQRGAEGEGAYAIADLGG